MCSIVQVQDTKYKYKFYSTYGYISKGLSSVTSTRDLDKYQSDRSSIRCALGDRNNYKSETSINISAQYMSFRRSE